MYDIILVGALVNMLSPLVSIYAWYKVHQHNKRMNGRLDELIVAKERIARDEGRKIGIAEGILIGQRG